MGETISLAAARTTLPGKSGGALYFPMHRTGATGSAAWPKRTLYPGPVRPAGRGLRRIYTTRRSFFLMRRNRWRGARGPGANYTLPVTVPLVRASLPVFLLISFFRSP